ncbi:hypothetical protein CEXT_734491 [Caerostris extrusa]|uniref:Uncharacterized protein n=1 Tax=Caerostris extrusa TaxID=172846 RepID=A0AAV4N2X7_CAEEX|nr:hypothetical protein CEXT_734491 [Caerostris extrusa]
MQVKHELQIRTYNAHRTCLRGKSSEQSLAQCKESLQIEDVGKSTWLRQPEPAELVKVEDRYRGNVEMN